MLIEPLLDQDGNDIADDFFLSEIRGAFYQHGLTLIPA